MTRVNRLFSVNGRWNHARGDMQRRSLERSPVTCRRKQTRPWMRGKLTSCGETVRRAEIWQRERGNCLQAVERGSPFLRKVENEWRKPQYIRRVTWRESMRDFVGFIAQAIMKQDKKQISRFSSRSLNLMSITELVTLLSESFENISNNRTFVFKKIIMSM